MAPAFTAGTAAVIGRSERAVQRDAERCEKIDAPVRELVARTDFDRGGYLNALKKVPREKQAEHVKADLVAPGSIFVAALAVQAEAVDQYADRVGLVGGLRSWYEWRLRVRDRNSSHPVRQGHLKHPRSALR
ncbi:hypothetical protein ACRBEV_04335 [Methylobacterium phyllosphaerae]